MKRASLLVTLFAWLAICPVLALAAPVGKIIGVVGDVEVTSPGKEAVKAHPGDELPGEAVLRTKSQGKCEVAFPDGSILRVAENSLLRLSASRRGKDEEPHRIIVELTRGKIQNIVKTTSRARAISTGNILSAYGEEIRNMVQTAVAAGGQRRYEVRTPTAVYRSRGTDFFAYSQADRSGAVVTEGRVEAFSLHRPGEVRQLGAGQATVVTDPKVPPLVKVATALEMEQHRKETAQTERYPERTAVAGLPSVPDAARIQADNLARLREESKPPLAAAVTPLLSERPLVLPTATDTHPPVITLSGLPASPTNSRSAAIGVAANESATFAFTLDGASLASPSLADLTEGSHTFAVTAIDPAGNSSTQTYTWTTDYTPPEIAITPQAAPRADGTADLTVSLTGNEAVAFTSDLDGEGPLSGSSLNRAALPAGDHTLTVEAMDGAGNASTQTLAFTLENYSLSAGLAGAVAGDVAVQVAGVAGRGWGGVTMDLAGDAAVLPEANAQAWAGGLLSGTANHGYWLAEMGGSAWTEGEVKGAVNYRSLTTQALGSFGGPLAGTYQFNPDRSLYEWQAAAGGVYAETPLLFSGEFDAGYHQYGNNLINYYSLISGYLGTTASPFASARDFGVPGAPMELYIMGEAWPEGGTTWWGSLYEAQAVSGDLLPDGFILGRTRAGNAGGRGTLTGFLASLYIDEAGNAGLLEGNFVGLDYPRGDGSGGKLFATTSGSARTTKKAEGYTSYDPLVNLGYNYLDGTFSGSFREGDFLPTGAIVADDSIAFISAGWTGSYTTWLQKSAAAPEPWGIFNIELGGQYLGTPADTWTMQLGGLSWRTWDGLEYWLAEVEGTQWSAGQITGTLRGNYLTPFVLGSIQGEVLGSYDTFAPGLWEGAAIGTFEEQPLTFVSDLASNDGLVSALLGGTESLWTNTETLALTMGAWNGGSGVWSMPVWNDNFADGSVTTYDGGAYRGFSSLVSDDGQEAAVGLIALYIDPNGQAGYLQGELFGTAYPDLGLYAAEGLIARTEMEAAPVGMTAANFDVTVNGPQSLTLAGAPGTPGFISETREEAWITGQNSWGIWQSLLEGSGASAPASWQWETALGADASYWTGYHDMTWTNNSANVLAGTVAGAKADWVNAATYVAGGEIKGLFNPATASWQALAQGAWLETGKFLEMTASNPLALQAMNIPAIQVGSATLSQGAGTVNNLSNVTLDNVRFFATSTGSVPRIWATQAVSGNFSAAPLVGGVAVPLAGSGLNANFAIGNWNAAAGTWGANVTGGTGTLSGGSYNGPVQFQGGAAGQIGPGSFTGTGAGVVK